DGRGETLRDRVVDLDRLGQVVELEEVEDRREGLLAGDWHVRRGLDQGRLDEEAGTVETLAAVEDPAALGLYRLDRLHHVVDRRAVDERPHERTRLRGIADPDRAVGGDQAPLHLGGD